MEGLIIFAENKKCILKRNKDGSLGAYPLEENPNEYVIYVSSPDQRNRPFGMRRTFKQESVSPMGRRSEAPTYTKSMRSDLLRRDRAQYMVKSEMDPEFFDEEDVEEYIAETAPRKRYVRPQRHGRVVRTDGAYSCHVCHKVFSSASLLDAHMVIHSYEGQYRCIVCNYIGYTMQELFNHVERRHARPSLFQCVLCGHVFRTELDLRDHKSECPAEGNMPLDKGQLGVMQQMQAGELEAGAESQSFTTIAPERLSRYIEPVHVNTRGLSSVTRPRPAMLPAGSTAPSRHQLFHYQSSAGAPASSVIMPIVESSSIQQQPPVAAKRGRKPKPVPEGPAPPKRPRGRPRKHRDEKVVEELVESETAVADVALNQPAGDTVSSGEMYVYEDEHGQQHVLDISQITADGQIVIDGQTMQVVQEQAPAPSQEESQPETIEVSQEQLNELADQGHIQLAQNEDGELMILGSDGNPVQLQYMENDSGERQLVIMPMAEPAASDSALHVADTSL